MYKIVILADVQPYDDKQGNFSAGSNQFVQQLFDDGVIDYSQDEIYMGYLSQTDLKPAEFRDVVAQMDFADVTHVITLGTKATEAFGIKGKLGEVIDKEFKFKNLTILPCYSPSSLKYNPGYAQQIAARIHQGIQLAFEGVSNKIERKSTPYEVINSFDRLMEVIELAKQTGLFSFDFETTGIEWWLNKPTMIGFSVQPGFSYIVPLFHFETEVWGKAMSYQEYLIAGQVRTIFELLKINIFENPDVVKIAHNTQFELGYLVKHGVDKQIGEWHDTMLMAHELDESRPKGLKPLTDIYFPEFAGYQFELPKDKTWAEIGLETLAKYCAIDTDVTLRLYMRFTEELLNDDLDGRLYRHYRSYVIPALFATFWASYQGAFVDMFEVEKNIKQAEENIKQLSQAFYNHPDVAGFVTKRKQDAINEAVQELRDKIKNQMAKEKPSQYWISKWNEQILLILNGQKEIESEFSLNAPKQVQAWLFDYLGLPERVNFYDESERTGRQDYVIELANTYDKPVLKIYCELKVTMKILSTYLSSFKELADSSGYIHTNFHVAGTDSGRLSSSKPNLQNVPSRNPLKESEYLSWAIKAPKSCFVAPPMDELGEWLFLQADFAQAELRAIANTSGDETMQKAYLDGIDLHTITGAKIAGVSLEEFLTWKESNPSKFKENRQKGKTANFGIVYGISVQGYQEYFRDSTGQVLSKQEAESHISAIFTAYSRLPYWHSEYELKAQTYKYVRNLYGRKRRLPLIDSYVSAERSSAKRVAINMPIQGTAGEWTVFGMAVLTKLVPRHLGRFSNTIHDAVYPYIRKNWLELLLPMYNDIMIDPLAEIYIDMDKDKLVVPMHVDWSYPKKSWADMEESSVEEIISKFAI
jgi:DNA polymerase I